MANDAGDAKGLILELADSGFGALLKNPEVRAYCANGFARGRVQTADKSPDPDLSRQNRDLRHSLSGRGDAAGDWARVDAMLARGRVLAPLIADNAELGDVLVTLWLVALDTVLAGRRAIPPSLSAEWAGWVGIAAKQVVEGHTHPHMGRVLQITKYLYTHGHEAALGDVWRALDEAGVDPAAMPDLSFD